MSPLPRIENRWTWGNVISAVPAVLALLAVMYMMFSNASAVPTLRAQVSINTTSILHLGDAVQALQNARRDDAQTAKDTRAEILTRLDRIETKLDQKADKDAQAHGWTR
jgi:hypothetical protein